MKKQQAAAYLVEIARDILDSDAAIVSVLTAVVAYDPRNPNQTMMSLDGVNVDEEMTKWIAQKILERINAPSTLAFNSDTGVKHMDKKVDEFKKCN